MRPAHAPQPRGRTPGRTRHRVPDRPRSGGPEGPAGCQQGQGAPVIPGGLSLTDGSTQRILAVVVRVGHGRRRLRQPPEAIGLVVVAQRFRLAGRAE